MGEKKTIWKLEGVDKTPKKPLWKLEDQEWWQAYSASVKAGEIQTVRMSQMEQIAMQNVLKAQTAVGGADTQMAAQIGSSAGYAGSYTGSAGSYGSYTGSGSGSGVLGYGLHLI